MVKLTNRAASVYEAQCALRQLSAMDAAIRPRIIPDGIYGKETQSAVRAFQKSMHLPMTGIINYPTWQLLFGNENE